MYQILTCLTTEHDLTSLAAAVFICIAGGVSSVALWRHLSGTEGMRRKLIFALAVLTVACSVWSTHFVAMTGYIYGYDQTISVTWTLASMLVAIVLYAAATYAMQSVDETLWRQAVAALLLTVAVAGMHYTGIMSFRESALVSLDPRYVFWSIVVCAVFNFGTARAFASTGPIVRGIGAPACFFLGVISLHFTGMTGLSLSPFGSVAEGGGTPWWLMPSLVGAMTVIVLGSAIAIVNDRIKMRQQQAEAERLRSLTNELRDTNSALCAARDAAEEATRSKSRFFANMSHEIRTPMNGVLGMAEILSNTSLTADQRECVSVIMSSGQALVAIINDILDASKLAEAKIVLDERPFDLRGVLEDVAVLTAPLAHAKNLRMHLRIDPAATTGRVGDAGRVRQVILNLVGNAIKFTETGSILIEMGPDHGTGPALIRVHDTGIGIDPRNLATIFEPFDQAETRTVSTHGGTGLGLTVSRAFANLMDGDISVESERGVGSTFTLTLGLAHDDAAVRAVPAVSGRFAVIAPDDTERDILVDLICGLGADPVVVDDPADIRPGAELRGVVLCCDAPPAPGTLPTGLPILLVGDGAVVTATLQDGGSVAARQLRPVRRTPLADWLTRPAAGEIRPAAPSERDVIDGPDVLIVDDNKVNRLVARKLLRGEAAFMAEAADGREACDLSAERAFSVILMDVSMPVMNGLEATRAIRARERDLGTARTTIVGLTAHASLEDRDLCLVAGMDDILTKPVSRAELLDALDRLDVLGPRDARSVA